ncbi:MFS transporter [Streptomyces sp. NPDC056309]|uniref:MFS transporter n=1 Tax=unclassified Streptomyces TaxID=2593676 RepID=UPI0035DB9FC1
MYEVSLASGLCAVSGGVAVFGLGRTIAGVGPGGLPPTVISRVTDYARGGRGALTVGALTTAHHAGGILSAYVAKWLVEPVGRRAAFWVCVAPLLFVPVLAKAMPESLSFLVAKGRADEARELAARYEVELPATPARKEGTDRWAALAGLRGDWGFTAFDPAGVSSMVFIGIAALRTPGNPAQSSPRQDLLAASRHSRPLRGRVTGGPARRGPGRCRPTSPRPRRRPPHPVGRRR